MNTFSAVVSPKAIGGWLGLFAFALCTSFVSSTTELAEAMPAYWTGFVRVKSTLIN